MAKTWNKTDLAEAVAEKCAMKKKDAVAAVEAVVETIVGALGNHDRVQLMGFGTFETRQRKERRGKNLRTGEEIVVPASVTPAFKASKALKDAVK